MKKLFLMFVLSALRELNANITYTEVPSAATSTATVKSALRTSSAS